LKKYQIPNKTGTPVKTRENQTIEKPQETLKSRKTRHYWLSWPAAQLTLPSDWMHSSMPEDGK
jgi:hypothetical protein